LTTERLDPEAKRLKRLKPGDLADEAFVAKTRLEAIKSEAIRRQLKTAEGQAGRITLSPPGTQQRSDRALLLQVLDITESEFTARFCRETRTDWRLTVSARRTIRAAA
jgi:hypothetical protein